MSDKLRNQKNDSEQATSPSQKNVAPQQNQGSSIPSPQAPKTSVAHATTKPLSKNPNTQAQGSAVKTSANGAKTSGQKSVPKTSTSVQSEASQQHSKAEAKQAGASKPTEPVKKANIKALQEFEALLKREFNQEYSELIESEISELEKITQMLGSVSIKLKKLYKSKFPKKCNTCKRVYESREDYIAATAEIGQAKSLVYDRFGLQEYRNCVCGSTLMILTDDRRDVSEFGIARRQLFDGCLEKLLALSNKSEEELKEQLRKVFQTIIEEVNEFNRAVEAGEK